MSVKLIHEACYVYTCDRCKKEEVSQRYKPTNWELFVRRGQVNLCGTCSKALDEWLSQ